MAKHMAEEQPAKKKRAVKIPNPLKANTSDGHTNVNPSMDETVTKFAQSNTNPEFEAFEDLVDTVRRAVRIAVDYRKSVGDTDDSTIKKYTSDTIKKHLRESRWA